MKSTDISNNPQITNVEVSKAATGLNLYFEFDGKPYIVTGDFYIDRQQVLHHTVVDENGNELTEVLVKLEF